jgi:circadian clock protein KaiC
MSKSGETPTLERVSTGIAGFDEALDGGIPARSITILAGEPGTGKTVFALQMLFAAARAGKTCLYCTTLSEPPMKIIRYMQLYDFFDEAVLAQGIALGDLGSTLRERGPDAALERLIELVDEHEPDLVVVDSFKAFHDLVDPQRQRTFVYDLAVNMAGWGTTTLLIGEYGEQEALALPEFGIADGIICMSTARNELNLIREIEVRKMRGTRFTTGVHFFEIHAGGVSFYPRVRGPDNPDPPVNARATRVSFGVAGLDHLLDGGVPGSSATVLLGGTGTGKTLLSLSFLVAGARAGEPGVLLSLEESAGQLRAIALGLGWDLAELERRGLLEIRYTSPVELSPDRFLWHALEAVDRLQARRLVLDSLSSLELGTPSQRRFKELVYALMRSLGSRGVTTVMPLEVPQLLGTTQVSGYGISFAADNLVYLRYTELQGRLHRAIAVLKARGIPHRTELCAMSIARGGVTVGEPLDELQGVLSGIPHKK